VGRPIFWKIMESVIVRKRNSYEHVFNSEWLPKYKCFNLQKKAV